jgi:hypothetical protein
MLGTLKSTIAIALITFPVVSLACTSDYSCGLGYACVKEPYKVRGQCMETVDEYGIRTFDMPRDSSIGPKMSGEGCTFVTDCPIGFQCDRDLEVCVKR